MKQLGFLVALSCYITFSHSQAVESGMPSSLPNINYHLTARPWKPLNLTRNAYLEKVEEIVRASVKFQNDSGAIIDPYAKREVQYATPYFANAVGVLLSAGKGADLLKTGIAAMNSATTDVANGREAIADEHGEFFLAPLASAILLYKPYVSATQLEIWKTRLAVPVNNVISGLTHNWRTYAMKGEWYRAKYGFVNKTTAVNWLESSWVHTQKARFTNNYWNFYHDAHSDPLPWAYESVARSNLLAMLADGYDGASRGEMLLLLKRATQSSLLLQDPTGQLTPGGRSSNHTWNDILMANGYEIMAEMAYKEGNTRLSGQYRRAAALGFQSVQRWQRTDGTFSVTKNHFDPKDRVRYANYSFFTNYNGNMMYHLAENYLRHKTNIKEAPMPSEIGGYTLVTDTALATAVANAGGMYMTIGLKGSTNLQHNNYWSTLGVVRFARSGWDSRLGPSDGIRERSSKLGVSFAPTFLENGTWVRLASMPERYVATLTTQFAHPVLVRFKLVYEPRSGYTGPTFTNWFIITPDGIRSRLSSTTGNFGITWPMLTFDGATNLITSKTSHIASTSFPNPSDQQNFIALHKSPIITATETTGRSSYGDLQPVRMVSGTAQNITFIYPRNSSDPTAEAVRKSYISTGADFSTLLGRVEGNTYVGRTAAGGVDTAVDIDADGQPEATFTVNTGFLMQLKIGEIQNIETDRAVRATIYNQTFDLQAYTPVSVVNSLKINIKKVLASADNGTVANKTIDGEYGTSWSANGNGQWIQYSFDTISTLKNVKIAWFRGDERQASFAIQTSLDGSHWHQVFEGLSSGTTPFIETYHVTLSSASYARIVCQGNSMNGWNAISEVIFIKENNNTKSDFLTHKSTVQTNLADSIQINKDDAYSKINILPNPGTGLFMIQIAPKWLNGLLSAYDPIGKLLIEKRLMSTNTELNLSNYAKDAYGIKVYKNGSFLKSQIVIQ